MAQVLIKSSYNISRHVYSSSVIKITFVVAEINYKMAVITSSVTKIIL